MPNILTFATEKISGYCLSVADILGGTDRFILKTETPLSIAVCVIFPFALYLAIKVGYKVSRKIKHKK